ncbi:MAG: hypothetical protein J5612_03805 [Paludibacteraceae bacterium]|nr:hypothetical protein [Paludibacteraceae bacterium]
MMLFFPVLCFAQYSERQLLAAYQTEDMSVWKHYIDSINDLPYEYGYCGYIVAEAKKADNEVQLDEAKRYVRLFRQHVESAKNSLPKGHYEMYMSAVYVFELRLHESIHPVKSMSLAKEATQLAPNDPIVLSYYGTCLFYAPKPFGSKAEALEWFQKAEQLFQDPKWQYRWEREANQMYITQCIEKLKK